MTDPLSRRRFIGISAAAAGLALLPFGASADVASDAIVWRGRALGAPAELIIRHPDRTLAQELLARVASEIVRLERIFSLHIPDSSLSRLNAAGLLAAPPGEIVELLARCHDVWAASGGVFDPTIQPLWTLHARHFAKPDADPSGPPRGELETALALVGFDRLVFDGSRVAFLTKGMALTLNGIAQGFITDRIVDMLRNAGVTNTLADIGEIRALGNRQDGSPWRVGLGDAIKVVSLIDRAVATSSPQGFRFAGPQSPAHLLHPCTGRSPSRYLSVSVLAPDATTADALSTACSFLSPEEVVALSKTFPSTEMHLHMEDGRHVHVG